MNVDDQDTTQFKSEQVLPKRTRHLLSKTRSMIWRVASIAFKGLTVMACLLAIVLLAFRYMVLPHIGEYQSEVEHMLGEALGRSVAIGRIAGVWDGFRPRLELHQVVIFDEQHQSGLTLPEVKLTLGWSSLLLAELRFYEIAINRPELELKRDAEGKLYVAGWKLDSSQATDIDALNWLFSQRAIIIRDGLVHWSDQTRKAPPLMLSNVNFVMKNQWQHHRFSLTATPPAELAGQLDVRADFIHHAFAKNIADYTQWKGTLYANLPKTDLAVWKRYVDYPFDVQQGAGSLRMWLSFDQTKVINITADAKLTDFRAKLGADLRVLDLINVSGWVSAQELGPDQPDVKLSWSERLKEHGHNIALTNFTFESRDGLYLPPTTLTERFTPAKKGEEEQLQFSTQFLDLTTLLRAAEYFPLPNGYRELLQQTQPAGQLSHFAVTLHGQLPEFSRYQVTGGFTDLELKALKDYSLKTDPKRPISFPGFAHLTGTIDANEKKGAIELFSKAVSLDMPDQFLKGDLQFDRIALKASWMQHDKQLSVTLNNLSIAAQDTEAHFFGTHSFSLQAKNKFAGVLSGTSDLTGQISRLDLSKVNRYLPNSTNAKLRHWLTHGLQHGAAEDISVRIRGNLTELPFVKKKFLDKNIFRITAKLNDAAINYLPGEFAKDGVNPYWPILSNVKGTLAFERERVDIYAESGQTADVSVANVRAVIPNIVSDNLSLQIDGLARGKAQNMLHYVASSPVLEWIGGFTQDTTMTGDAALKLKLDIPLFHLSTTKVDGSVQFDGNDIVLLKEFPPLSRVNGRVDFDERGLSLKSIKGLFLGGPVTVAGGTQNNGIIQIKVQGQMSAEGVRAAFPRPELKNVLTRIEGRTPFSATIQVKNKKTDIWVDSPLQGMALHWPEPLNKAAATAWPLHIEMTNVSNQMLKATPGLMQDEVKFSLGNIVHAYYLRERASSNAPWKVLRGGIGFNAPAPTPDSGIAVHLDLVKLDVDAFSSLLPDKAVHRGKTDTPAVGQEDSEPGAINVYQYIEANTVSMHALALTWFGKKIDAVVLGAARFNGVWQANIDSKQLSGYLTWDNALHGLGHVTARLSKLVIPESQTSDVVDLLQSKDIHSSIPGLDVIVDDIDVFGKKLGRLELQAKNSTTKNALGPDEWQINALRISNPDAEFTAQGKWINGKKSDERPQSETNFSYQLTLTSVGKLLDRLGYANLISGGKGKINGEVSWLGSPYSMDIPSLSGQIQLDIHSGRFHKVEPGAAKLLAVLNLQSLPRRLVLDFRDVFSEGFSFDGLTGDVRIKHGVATTENLKMHSPSATVVLSGSADIIDETQNLRVIVVPEVNAAAASVVYGLAVNPIIGVGTFLAQLFLRKPLMRAFTFEYHVTGPWKDPNVVKVQVADNKG